MAKTGRPSTVANHPQVARIDSMLDDGVSYAEVSTRFGVTPSSVGRYALSRKSDLAKLADREPNVTDLTVRLLDAADHARDARRYAKVSGSPVAQTRAIATEASILGKLLADLDVRDSREADLHRQVGELVSALQEHAKNAPDSARSLLETMRAHPQLNDLTRALAGQLEKTA